MNEKSLEVLNQYNLRLIRATRGRGGLIVYTDKGEKLLAECVKQDKYYLREDVITSAVSEAGFEYVDTYVRNADGGIISELADEGRKYILKDMYQGNECNIRSVRDISQAAAALARLHIALDEAKSAIISEENDFTVARGNIANKIARQTREIRSAANYLKNRKQKSEYERTICRNIEHFYQEALRAEEMMARQYIQDGIADADAQNQLIHGNYTYHNIIMTESGTAVTNMEKCRIDVQVFDLYQFMRKVLEKYNWDIDLGYRILNEYDKVRRINDAEIGIITVLFAFPEKFFKLVNQYHNMNKAWVSPKSIEKLEAVLNGNAKRLDFLATLISL